MPLSLEYFSPSVEDADEGSLDASSAYLMDKNMRALPGKIDFRKSTKAGVNGILRGDSGAAGAMAMTVQYDVAGRGRLMLQTCLLRQRDEPYNLSVELARHRIKMFLSKSEEWQMFDLSKEHPAVANWEDARQLLTRALFAEDGCEAARLANKALAKSVDASERLATAHAQILLHRRYGQRAASTTTLGLRLLPSRFDQSVLDLVEREFDVVSLPLIWRDMEPRQGEIDWRATDRLMSWAEKCGKPVLAGPLLNLSERWMPDWMQVWQHDYKACRDLLYDHLHRVVDRYKNAVAIWNVGSGLNLNDYFSFTPQQLLDLTRMSVLAVREARRTARCLLELREPFGEHGAINKNSIAPRVFLEQVLQEGIRIDAIGVQLLFGDARGGIQVRDLMQVSDLLDSFFLIEIPVVLTAIGVPSEQGQGEASLGGQWMGPWSQEKQAMWATRTFAMSLSKPFVDSVLWTDLYDHEGVALRHSGLISEKGKPKMALSRLAAHRRTLRKPLGPLRLPVKAIT